MLWILINIRPHIRHNIIDLLLLLWHVRAPAHLVLFVCDRALFLTIDEIIRCRKLLDWCLIRLLR